MAEHPYRAPGPPARLRRTELLRLWTDSEARLIVALRTGNLERAPIRAVLEASVSIRIGTRNLESIATHDEVVFDAAVKFVPVVTGLLAVGLRTHYFLLAALAVVPWWYCVWRLRLARLMAGLARRLGPLTDTVDKILERRRDEVAAAAAAADQAAAGAGGAQTRVEVESEELGAEPVQAPQRSRQ